MWLEIHANANRMNARRDGAREAIRARSSTVDARDVSPHLDDATDRSRVARRALPTTLFRIL